MQNYRLLPSPVGTLTLVAVETGLAAILWENDDPARVRMGALTENAEHPVLREAARQLRAYFAGKLKRFDLPLAASGTGFQHKVWDALLTIPFGETRSYGAIARQIGHPSAYRAVGAANGKNPLSIVVPCHRAIGANGSLTGFAGGIAIKRRLLDLEGRRDLFAA